MKPVIEVLCVCGVYCSPCLCSLADFVQTLQICVTLCRFGRFCADIADLCDLVQIWCRPGAEIVQRLWRSLLVQVLENAGVFSEA